MRLHIGADLTHPLTYQLWPTHRSLCGGDPNLFRQAALSQEEAEILAGELSQLYHDGLPLNEPRMYTGQSCLQILRSFTSIRNGNVSPRRSSKSLSPLGKRS